jgi:hypothetical protein
MGKITRTQRYSYKSAPIIKVKAIIQGNSRHGAGTLLDKKLANTAIYMNLLKDAPAAAHYGYRRATLWAACQLRWQV